MEAPIDEAEYARVMRLAARAEQLLADEDFLAIITYLKRRATDAWANTSRLQSEEREKVWHDLQAVSRLEAYLAELKAQRRRELSADERANHISLRRAERRSAGYG
jgi:hypothetical protein